MPAPESPQKQFRNLLKAAVVFFAIFVLVGLIYFSGILKPLASGFVNHSINTMQKESDRQANQPRIVVMKNWRTIRVQTSVGRREFSDVGLY